MLESLLALTFALQTAAADTLTPEAEPSPPRVVLRLREVVVRANPLHDMLSSQSVQLVGRDALRLQPVSGLTEVLALQAGVVARGEDLHVRGGRRGDLRIALRGIPLNEALRARPMEVPLLAIESIELLDGGLDAEHGGAVAGVAQIRTVSASPRPQFIARWEGDADWSNDFTQATGYHRATALLSAPIGLGLGAVVSADVLADDTYVPALRERPQWNSWRADNRLLGFFKLAPLTGMDGAALEVLASRRVQRPYNPMWSLDGYTNPSTGVFGSEGPAFSEEPLPGYNRYRAAEHALMTDESRAAVVLSAQGPLGAGRLRGAAGWVEMRRLGSVGGGDDESYLDPTRSPVFGRPESSVNDPFFVYQGDEPFFHRSQARTLSGRGDYDATFASGSRYGFGAGLSYDHVTFRELDLTTLHTGFDSLRTFEAFAPGAFAYAQGRWVREGLVLNGGLRLEAFTAGPQSEDQSLGVPARTLWTLSPRLGIAYPVSTRDVVSLSYTRVQQDPGRAYLYDNRRFITQRQPMGNVTLVPTTMISYQVALKHLFDNGRALQAAVFYRDLYGQIGAREHREGFINFPRYENADKGNAQGFELGLVLPAGERTRLEAQYTFMHAVGTQSLEEGIPYGGRQTPRTESLGDYPLDWDVRHSLALTAIWQHEPKTPDRPARGPIELLLRGLRGPFSAAMNTRFATGMPWTATPRAGLSDPALTNQERFSWQEQTSLGLRWTPLLTGRRLTLGLEIRNLFDFRSDRVATLSGYPHPLINTTYDDYGSFRGETGLGGGAYWDADDRGIPDAWVRVHDPRLLNAPRLIRFSLGTDW